MFGLKFFTEWRIFHLPAKNPDQTTPRKSAHESMVFSSGPRASAETSSFSSSMSSQSTLHGSATSNDAHDPASLEAMCSPHRAISVSRSPPSSSSRTNERDAASRTMAFSSFSNAWRMPREDLGAGVAEGILAMPPSAEGTQGWPPLLPQLTPPKMSARCSSLSAHELMSTIASASSARRAGELSMRVPDASRLTCLSFPFALQAGIITSDKSINSAGVSSSRTRTRDKLEASSAQTVRICARSRGPGRFATVKRWVYSAWRVDPLLLIQFKFHGGSVPDFEHRHNVLYAYVFDVKLKRKSN